MSASLSEPFIRRPVATSLLAAALLLSGAVAYTQLPVSPLPRVDFPTINVSASLPGASPETMASAVATPLERRFGRIAGLAELTSTSTLGQTNVTLQFALDRDVDAAARDVQAAINAAAGDLPANLPSRPTYRKVNPSDAPILILSLSSATLPLSQVFDTANTILAQRISQVPGVGQVFVGGAQQPAVRVQVDPDALAGLGLGLEDVRNALAQATLDQPKGSLPGPAVTRTIAANDQLTSAAAYRPLILSTVNGAPVRLGDVATVVDGVENERAAGWIDGRRAVVMLVRRQPGANIIEVNDRVKALLPQLTRDISPAIDVQVAIDRSQAIRASVRDVELTLAFAVALVVGVVFVFLRSARATAIPSVAVPLALVATFAVMYLLGYSLDNLSLMALTISTGFVVDDAIVVTENVTRYVEAGLPPMQAALTGAREIGFTIVSITASLLAVFIPILLMGGVVGRLFREFAVTLSVAIALSAVVSLTVTPMMAARLLRQSPAEGYGRPARLSQTSRHGFEALVAGYDRALRWVLGHSAPVLVATVATAVLSIALYAVVPKGLFPQQNTGQLAGFSDAPQDISFPAMMAAQERLTGVVMSQPSVEHMISFVGGGTLNTGFVFVQLRPSSRESPDQVIGELRPKLAQVPGIALYLQSVQDLRVGGRISRTQYQYTLQDADLAELDGWAPRLLEALRRVPELRDVASDQQTSALQLRVRIDRDTAARMGITASEIDGVLYDAFGQRQVATIFGPLNQYHVILEVKPPFQAGPDGLAHLHLPAAGGQQVPLGAITQATPEPTSLSVNHQGQFPAITLSFNLAPGVALGQALQAVERTRRQIGLPASIHATFQGTAQAFVESLRSEPLLVLAALVAVYIVLGVLYESLVHPITILSTLPSAGVGALLALLLFRLDLDIIALIGVILLIGIVKKNAILMIDFAIEAERREGLGPREAIHRACLLRFRPILMTTLAAMLAGLPLALGVGAGGELRRPLGIAVVGGLLLSQLLTLFTTPVVYLALDRLGRRLRRPAPVREGDAPARA